LVEEVWLRPVEELEDDDVEDVDVSAAFMVDVTVGVVPPMVTVAAEVGTDTATGAEIVVDAGTVDTDTSTGAVADEGAGTDVGEIETGAELVVATENSFWRPGTVLASWATAAATALSAEAAVTF